MQQRMMPDATYAIDITYRVKRNNFCASQYDAKARSSAENRDVYHPEGSWDLQNTGSERVIFIVLERPGDSRNRHSFRAK